MIPLRISRTETINRTMDAEGITLCHCEETLVPVLKPGTRLDKNENRKQRSNNNGARHITFGHGDADGGWRGSVEGPAVDPSQDGGIGLSVAGQRGRTGVVSATGKSHAVHRWRRRAMGDQLFLRGYFIPVR
jgi:hypothetical protein